MRRCLTKLFSGRWFENLSFGCTQCGKCCRGKINVFINEEEISQMADYLNLNDDFLFAEKYTKTIRQNDQTLISLKSKPNRNECVFLDSSSKKCTIYDVRPTQCRTYPFWPQNVIGSSEWESEARRCEGIKISPYIPTSDCDNKNKPDISSGMPTQLFQSDSSKLDNPISSSNSENVVQLPYILHQLVLTQVHARGTGPCWHHDDAAEHLRDCEQLEPNMLTEYSDEFFNTHFSQIVYETDHLLVVDTTVPITDKSSDLDRHPGTHTIEAIPVQPTLSHGEGNSESYQFKTTDEINIEHSTENKTQSTEIDLSDLVTTRRLEFKSASSMVQSEVRLVNGKADHTHLCLPIHRHMAKVITGFLSYIQTATEKEIKDALICKEKLINTVGNLNQSHSGSSSSSRIVTITEPRSLRIGMIGAGGCSLPNYLLTNLNSGTTALSSFTQTTADDTTSSGKTSQKTFRHIQIDCIDNDPEVLEIAEAYFDCSFINKSIPDDSDHEKSVTPSSASTSSNLNNQNHTSSKCAQNRRKSALKPDSIDYASLNQSGLLSHAIDGKRFLKHHLRQIFTYSSGKETTFYVGDDGKLHQEEIDSDDDELVESMYGSPFEYDVLVIDAYSPKESSSSQSCNSAIDKAKKQPSAFSTNTDARDHDREESSTASTSHVDDSDNEDDFEVIDWNDEVVEEITTQAQAPTTERPSNTSCSVDATKKASTDSTQFTILKTTNTRRLTSKNVRCAKSPNVRSKSKLKKSFNKPFRTRALSKSIPRYVSNASTSITVRSGENINSEPKPNDRLIDNDEDFTAPPESLLSDTETLFACLKEKQGGIVMNVYGNIVWLTHVFEVLKQQAAEYEFLLPIVLKIDSEGKLGHLTLPEMEEMNCEGSNEQLNYIVLATALPDNNASGQNSEDITSAVHTDILKKIL